MRRFNQKSFKGHRVILEKKFKAQNFNVYNINEVIIQHPFPQLNKQAFLRAVFEAGVPLGAVCGCHSQ